MYTIVAVTLCLLVLSSAQPTQPSVPSNVQPTQPGVMSPSGVDPNAASTPQPNPNVAIPQVFQRGSPEQYSLQLCDESVEVPCDNDLLCLRVGALRNKNSEKSFYRCVQGKCKKTSCLFDNDCDDDEFCNSNGACAKLQYVALGETCKPEQAILCRPPLQCNLRSMKCEEGLLEGATCDSSGTTLWPPCPKDFACIQWDGNSAKCTKQVMYLRQEDQTCSTSKNADPFTKCAEGLACVNGKCRPEIVPQSLVKEDECSDSCVDNKECVTRICRQGKCLERALLVGESCLVNEQCVSGQCENGKCSGVDCSVTKCGAGKICTFDRLKRNFSCVEDPTLCNDDKTMMYVIDKCVPRPRMGESCDIGGIPCIDPYHCDFQQKKCVESSTRDQQCAWSAQYTDNCTLMGKEACQCVGESAKCKVVDPQQIISSKISNSERCVRFTTRNSPLFNECVRELSQFSPASSLFDVASRNLKNCKKYWATFYCCSICMGVELDLLNRENMTEEIQTYLPGLQCTPEPKWNVHFGAQNSGGNSRTSDRNSDRNSDKCVFKGFSSPKSRRFYKDEICGNFLEKFNKKEDEMEMPVEEGGGAREGARGEERGGAREGGRDVVETQQPYGTEPAHNQAVNESYFTRPSRPSLANTQSGYGTEPAHDQGLAFSPVNPAAEQGAGQGVGQGAGQGAGQGVAQQGGQMGGQQGGQVYTLPAQPSGYGAGQGVGQGVGQGGVQQGYNQPYQQGQLGGQQQEAGQGATQGAGQGGAVRVASDGQSLIVGILGVLALPLFLAVMS